MSLLHAPIELPKRCESLESMPEDPATSPALLCLYLSRGMKLTRFVEVYVLYLISETHPRQLHLPFETRIRQPPTGITYIQSAVELGVESAIQKLDLRTAQSSNLLLIMSRASKIFLGSSIAASAFTVWGVHFLQERESTVRPALYPVAHMPKLT
jgi:hypothetical protein